MTGPEPPTSSVDGPSVGAVQKLVRKGSYKRLVCPINQERRVLSAGDDLFSSTHIPAMEVGMLIRRPPTTTSSGAPSTTPSITVLVHKEQRRGRGWSDHPMGVGHVRRVDKTSQ